MRARTRNARGSEREASSSFADQADQGPAASEHVKAARWYLERAYELPARGDPYDAAEKVWAAVKSATETLTSRVLAAPVPPKGSGWRIFVKEAFLKAGLSEEEAEKLAAYYIDVRDRLHGACFYGLLYEESEHKPLMERARWYIDLVERVLERLPS